MWCAPRSVSCLCFQCVHYLRRDRKSQFPTQHFPWEHGTKFPEDRGIFSLICEKAPLRGTRSHTCPARAHKSGRLVQIFVEPCTASLPGDGADNEAHKGFAKFKMQRIYFAEEVDFLQKRVII